MAALFELGALIAPKHLDDELVARLRTLAGTDGVDETRIGEPAQRLIAANETRGQ